MRALLSLVALGACTFDRPTDVTFGEAAITITEGDRQTGVVDTDLPMALKVNVTDGDFKPIENFTVEFTVRDANGELSDDAVRTDAQGNARTELKLGTRSGDQFVDVSGEGIEGNEPVFFTQTALADVPAQISAYAGDGESATVATQLAAPLVARVEDRFGNPSPAGLDVAFVIASGGGSLSSSGGTSGADGTVSTLLTLGTGSGAQTVDATATGLTKATFTLNGAADVPVSMERVSPATLLAEALKPSEEMVVLARDTYGNPAPGASIMFARTGGTGPAGTITNATVVTDANGRAVNTIVAASLAGTNIVTATGSLTGSGLTFTATTRNISAGTQLGSAGQQTGTVAVGDLNGDTKPDVVVGTQLVTPTSFTGFTVYLNTTATGATTATFSSGTQVVSPIVNSNSRISIVDATGDGVPDVVVNYTNAYVHRNTTPTGATAPTFAAAFTGSSSNGHPTVVDIDGDQLLDVVTLGNQFRALRRTGATTFSSSQYFGSINEENQAHVSDVNGDGKADVTALYSGNVYTYLNMTAVGATSFSFAQTNTSVSGGFGSFADFDGDTKPDWIVSNASTTQVYRNTTVTTPSFTADPTIATGLYAPVVVLDLNADGKLDVLGSSASTVRLLLNTSAQGATSFVAADTTIPLSYSSSTRVHVADLNADGRPDIILDASGQTTFVLAQ